MSDSQKNVWYACYGSNLNRQRFLCYIQGGKPTYGRRNNKKPCLDKTPPSGDLPYELQYRLYFALPNAKTTTENWGNGGVAFISPNIESDRVRTLCRLWRITEEQYEEIRDKEGRTWYNKEIILGHMDGIPIKTITNENDLTNILLPSESYLKTIALGLEEAYGLADERIADYLDEKPGISGRIKQDELVKIVHTAISKSEGR